MNHEQKIQELQERINVLAGNINVSVYEIKKLQIELNALRGQEEPGFKTMQNEQVPAPSYSESRRIESFIRLKLMHLVGIVVLVTGISIGVKYAIDKQLISEAVRIVLAYAAAILLFTISIRLKKQYHLFSAILFSGSMASLYFTTYAASVYYHFLPAIAAFLLMVALTVYTVMMATVYDRKEIAIIGMVGAYGIPFLVSANAERVDLFFSYILLINTGIVFLSFKKRWKLMSQLALVITWILFVGWGIIRFEPSLQWVGVAFMALYYLLFFINALAYRLLHQVELSKGDMLQIGFNNLACYIAAVIVFGGGTWQLGWADITGYMCLLTVSLSLSGIKFFPFELLLQRSLIWQSLVLLLSFIALRWDGYMVTLLWVVVSVLLFAWGIAGQKTWARLASILLIGITLIKLFMFDSVGFTTIQKIGCYILIGALLLLFSFYYQKPGLSKKHDN